MAWGKGGNMNKNKMLKLNIQLFAEEETTNVENPVEKTLTFDEMLSKENYQSEFDKRVAKSLETSRAKWEKEYADKLEAQKTEAEKFAKMDAEQKLTFEKEKAEKRAQEIEAKLNAYELKDQALKLAKEQSIDVSLLELIDFTKENADSVSTKINNIKTNFDKALENALNSKLKQDTPKEYGNTKDEEDPYLKGFRNYK